MTDTPDTYLFSRGRGAKRWAGDDPEALVGIMFYDLWKTRQQPFATLKDGDNMLLLETTSRQLIWHFRAAAVTKQEYHSIPEALDIIRQTFGLLPENLGGNYWQGRPDHGYVLAWAVEVVQPLDIEMPKGFRMNQNGYMPIDSIRVEMRPSIPSYDPAQVLTRPMAYVGGIDLREPGDRYIPQSVRQQVMKRDEGKCTQCNRQPPEIELHFDHIWPFSRGGTNNADNIQLLCADHNLSKAASILDGAVAPPDSTLREAIAAKHKLDESTPLPELIKAADMTDEQIVELLIDEAGRFQTDEVQALLESRLDIPHRDLIHSHIAWARFGIEDDQLVRNMAEGLLSSDDQDAATKAAFIMWATAETDIDDALLRKAVTSTDPSTRATAAMELAGLLEEDGDLEALTFMRQALADGDRDIRAWAAIAIVEFDKLYPEEVLELLGIARASEDPELSGKAAIMTAQAFINFEQPEDAIPYLKFASQSELEEIQDEAEVLWAHCAEAAIAADKIPGGPDE